jgi:hypothetical protein
MIPRGRRLSTLRPSLRTTVSLIPLSVSTRQMQSLVDLITSRNDCRARRHRPVEACRWIGCLLEETPSPDDVGASELRARFQALAIRSARWPQASGEAERELRGYEIKESFDAFPPYRFRHLLSQQCLHGLGTDRHPLSSLTFDRSRISSREGLALRIGVEPARGLARLLSQREYGDLLSSVGNTQRYRGGRA